MAESKLRDLSMDFSVKIEGIKNDERHWNQSDECQ